MNAQKTWEITERMMLGDFSFVKDYNENHDPKTGQFASGSGGGSKSFESLKPKNSYTNSEEYKSIGKKFHEAWDRDDELRKKEEDLKEEFKKESWTKPKEEWTAEEKLDAYIWGPPKITTERGAEIKKELEQISKERIAVREERDRAGEELKKIKEKEHRKQIKNYTPSLSRPATKSEYEGFKTDTTGMSFYDDILRGEKPGYLGKVREMSPKEYIEKCAYEIFHNATMESTLGGISKENIKKYKDMMKSGTKFDLPVLSYKEHAQEGRHRALAAYELGIETIPVLEVY